MTDQARTCELKLGLRCGLNLPLNCNPIYVFSHPLQTPTVASPAQAHLAMQPLPCGTSSSAIGDAITRCAGGGTGRPARPSWMIPSLPLVPAAAHAAAGPRGGGRFKHRCCSSRGGLSFLRRRVGQLPRQQQVLHPFSCRIVPSGQILAGRTRWGPPDAHASPSPLFVR